MNCIEPHCLSVYLLPARVQCQVDKVRTMFGNQSLDVTVLHSHGLFITAPYTTELPTTTMFPTELPTTALWTSSITYTSQVMGTTKLQYISTEHNRTMNKDAHHIRTSPSLYYNLWALFA